MRVGSTFKLYVMNKYEHLKSKVEDGKFSSLSKDELFYLTGGNNASGQAEGSYSSDTEGSETVPPCDNTCTCTCIPPDDDPQPTDDGGDGGN